MALRNPLTRRHPALPLPRETRTIDNSSKQLRERDLVDENAINGVQYGIGKVFLKNQETQRRRWQEDLDSAILRTGQPVPRKYWEVPESEKGNIHAHCAYCYSTTCDKRYNFCILICCSTCGGPSSLISRYNYSEDGDEKQSCAVIQCSWGCGASLHHCKTFEHQMLCKHHEQEGEHDWMLRDDYGRSRVPKKKVKPPPALKAAVSLLALPCSMPAARTMGSTPPPPPPLPSSLHQGMRFDIKVETVTRLQQKPRAMYTFLCGAELRRDQWEGHCR